MRRSLVGSQIEVHATTTSVAVSSPYTDNPTPRAGSNTPGMNVEDLHPPISPKSSGEEFFFGGEIDTQTVSATVLSEQLYLTMRARSTATNTVDDFVTAADQEDFMTAIADPLSMNFSHSNFDSPMKDALTFSRSFESDSPPSPQFHDSNMTSSPTSPARTSYEINPAEKAYVTAKDVWSWGKSVMVFKPFLGIDEGVAGKMVSVVGSSMSDLDGAVTSNLTKVDDNILNPAIETIVKIVFGAMQKTEDMVKPVIMAVLKPIGLVKSKAENPELTTTYKSAVTPS
ncbi:hypothetical protein MPSEU_000077500 [Mayamaea pseudoterrestris]|nr:hypothetical protein MPSEU_000077500 [Mayamaea pseudoterrestris]